jgi:hypothetical protein
LKAPYTIPLRGFARREDKDEVESVYDGRETPPSTAARARPGEPSCA